MDGFDEKYIRELLTQTGSIIDKYDAIARETGSNFNIFDITRIEYDEVIVCRVLAELLNPKGSHGQGGAYLKLFLEDCLNQHHHRENDIDKATVTTEHYADGRRIDIAIQVGKSFIPIEVKINAGDQDQQCYAYYEYAFKRMNNHHAQVVYLTLDGRSPKPYSARELGEDEILCISFAKHIKKWLKKCLVLPDTIQKAPVREILVQFISAIRKITNQLEDKPMNEMIQLLSASEMSMRNAQAIADTVEACRIQKVREFFHAFYERFKAQNLEREKSNWEYDIQGRQSAEVCLTYMFEREAMQGINVVFILSCEKVFYRQLVAGFGMMKSGEPIHIGDGKMVNDLREHYRISDGKFADWRICYEYITFDEKPINLIDFYGDDENYFKLFDHDKFEQIVESTVKQAEAALSRLKHS